MSLHMATTIITIIARVPYDAIISEGLLMKRIQTTSARTRILSSEIKGSYVIKVDGKILCLP